MKAELARIATRGISYHLEDGTEIGSIVIRPEHIAFIAGNWCRQISRRAKRQEILVLSREHTQRLQRLCATPTS